MNIESPLVKAVPEAIRRRPTSQSHISQGTRRFAKKSDAYTGRDVFVTNDGLIWSTERSVSRCQKMELDHANPSWTALERPVINRIMRFSEKFQKIQV